MAIQKTSGSTPRGYKILFVCTGNICRSPLAEAVFRHHITAAGLTKQVDIGSAGTHAHVGEVPDSRTMETGVTRGFDMKSLRARQIELEDFQAFDLILAMDKANYNFLGRMKPEGTRAEVRMFLDYHPRMMGQNVPDPYYSGPEGFTQVQDMVEETSRHLVTAIKKTFK